jgi:hypothetical protein
MEWFGHAWYWWPRKVLGILFFLSATFRLLGFPADIPTWYHCLSIGGDTCETIRAAFPIGLSKMHIETWDTWTTIYLLVLVLGLALLFAPTRKGKSIIEREKLPEEMRQQNRPYVYIVHDGNWLVLKNSGNRSAHDIQIEVTRDALVPKQYKSFATVTITKAGEPPPPSPDPITPQKWAELLQGTQRTSDLPGIKTVTPTLVPDTDKRIAHVGRYIGHNAAQRLDYTIRYRDGAGLLYEEQLTTEYEI